MTCDSDEVIIFTRLPPPQTLHDYLYRNLNLFRLESTFEIREDVVDSAKRIPARLDADGNIQFEG